MDTHSIVLFAMASLSINLIPGPDVVYIISTTMGGKVNNGIKAAVGLGVGYLVHTVAACLGLSAIILSSALAFSIIKWLGAAYLIYLGIQSLLSMWNGKSKIEISKPGGKTSKSILVQGVIISILNPKVALFFLSFLPQFIDITSPSATGDLLMLGILFSLLATICNAMYASIGSLIFNKPSSARYTRVLEGVSGGLLIGLAGKIALSTR